MKYLVLAGVSSAFVLFGLALIYYERGTMRLAELASGGPFGALAWAGLAMVLVGLGFKLALVPFHLWTPDVFQGSPMPVAALIATDVEGVRVRPAAAGPCSLRCLWRPWPWS